MKSNKNKNEKKNFELTKNSNNSKKKRIGKKKSIETVIKNKVVKNKVVKSKINCSNEHDKIFENCLVEKNENKNENEKFLNEIKKINKIFSLICKKIKFDDNFKICNKKKIYEVGSDSKIISKLYEIIIIESLKEKLKLNKFNFLENNIQNKYPDFIIISNVDEHYFYAIDIKSTYMINKKQINGFTLGTYKGYFKNRNSISSIVKPYDKFIKHYCICVIYERLANKIPVKYLFLREKWEIASNIAGSGNTCNIGSIKNIDSIMNNKHYFESEEKFNEFWLKK